MLLSRERGHLEPALPVLRMKSSAWLQGPLTGRAHCSCQLSRGQNVSCITMKEENSANFLAANLACQVRSLTLILQPDQPVRVQHLHSPTSTSGISVTISKPQRCSPQGGPQGGGQQGEASEQGTLHAAKAACARQPTGAGRQTDILQRADSQPTQPARSSGSTRVPTQR